MPLGMPWKQPDGRPLRMVWLTPAVGKRGWIYRPAMYVIGNTSSGMDLWRNFAS